MTCDSSGTIGGAGCVLLVDHDGDHETVEGATWPQLVQRDCPRCGEAMHTRPDTAASQICAACQDASLAEKVGEGT